MTLQQSINTIIGEIMTWGKRIAALLLLVFFVVVGFRLFGVSVPYLQAATLGWQELGVFLAGTAFALKNL